MILTRNDSTLLANTHYFVVILHHNVSLSWCDCFGPLFFCLMFLFVCLFVGICLVCLCVLLFVCLICLCVCIILFCIAVCIWAYGQNTINHLKSELSLSLSLSLSLLLYTLLLFEQFALLLLTYCV